MDWRPGTWNTYLSSFRARFARASRLSAPELFHVGRGTSDSGEVEPLLFHGHLTWGQRAGSGFRFPRGKLRKMLQRSEQLDKYKL